MSGPLILLALVAAVAVGFWLHAELDALLLRRRIRRAWRDGPHCLPVHPHERRPW